MENKRAERHLCNFHIAGFTFHEGCMVFGELNIGSRLRFEREADNRFDPYAVAIYYRNRKLGFVPRDQNTLIAQLLDLGYHNIFEVVVQRLSPDAHPEKQVGIVVFLREAKEAFHR